MATGVQACEAFDPSLSWTNASAADACCCDFAYPLIISNLAGATLYDTNRIEAQSGLGVEVVIDMVNILVWISLVTIVVANAIWVLEKTNPDKNPFERDYISGSFDAVWDVSNGFASVKTNCSRLLGLAFQYFNMALFGLLAGTISSVLTSAAQQNAVYRWNELADVSHNARACVPPPSFLNYELVQAVGSNVYVPPDNKYETCILDLFNGDCDVIIGQQLNFESILARNQTLANSLQILSSDVDIVASYFVPREPKDVPTFSPLKDLFQQALISSLDKRAEWQSAFFSFEVETEEDTSEEPPEWYDIVDWPPLLALAAYSLFMFIATTIRNARRGYKCVCQRVCIVLTNFQRKTRLQGRVRVKSTYSVADLPAHIHDAFRLLDRDGSGSIEEDEFELLSIKLTERHKSDPDVDEKDVVEVKNFLLEIYNANIDGTVSPQVFEEAFMQTVHSPGAQELIWDLARHKVVDDFPIAARSPPSFSRRKAVSEAVIDLEGVGSGIELPETTGPPSNKSRLEKPANNTSPERHEIVAAVRGRRGTALPPLQSKHAVALIRQFRKAMNDSSWRTNGRLSKPARDAVVTAFSREHNFTDAGTEKMKIAFDTIFDKCSSDDEAIARCQEIYDAVLNDLKRNSASGNDGVHKVEAASGEQASVSSAIAQFEQDTSALLATLRKRLATTLP